MTYPLRSEQAHHLTFHVDFSPDDVQEMSNKPPMYQIEGDQIYVGTIDGIFAMLSWYDGPK